jgi:formylglycine-generating enzyme required for sulfatase activity
MGSDRGKDREKPQHWLEMRYFCWLGRFPITNAQFAVFVAGGGYATERYWLEAKATNVWRKDSVKDGVRGDPRSQPRQFGHPFDLPNHPVAGISWYEAMAFARWLTYRWLGQGRLPDKWITPLPTETEWEKAAQGSGEVPETPVVRPISLIRAEAEPRLTLRPNPFPQGIYIWGNAGDPNRANYQESGISTTNAAGCFPGGISPYGPEEMAGNMHEWLHSKYLVCDYQMNEFCVEDPLAITTATCAVRTALKSHRTTATGMAQI